MEEKERYKWSQDVIAECAYEDYDYIVDTENNIIFNDEYYFKLVDILNQQDKRIKELEGKILIQLNNNADNVNFMENQRRENQQLKEQLHDLPKQIVREIRDVAEDYQDYDICEECGNIIDLHTLSKKDFDEILDRILKKYGGEYEN